MNGKSLATRKHSLKSTSSRNGAQEKPAPLAHLCDNTVALSAILNELKHDFWGGKNDAWMHTNRE
jgi:hypothetical protein